MSTKNSHGVYVSKIKKGDLVVLRVSANDNTEQLPVKLNNGVWVDRDSIIRHIPADEPMTAPHPVRLGDKPAREMTVREEFVKSLAQGLMADGATRSFDWKWLVSEADALLSVLEGSAGK